MTIQDDFRAGAIEYARRLEEQKANDRRAELALEARDLTTGAAFAEFFESRLTQHDTDTTTQEN